MTLDYWKTDTKGSSVNWFFNAAKIFDVKTHCMMDYSGGSGTINSQLFGYRLYRWQILITYALPNISVASTDGLKLDHFEKVCLSVST